MERSHLRLAVAYEPYERYNVPSCAFSKCGNYFAFVESPCVAVVYPVGPFMKACFADFRVSMFPCDSPDPPNIFSSNLRRSWRIVTSELLGGDSVPIDIRPMCRIEVNGAIQHIAFALGDISHCRLPHRSQKRMSRVLHGSCVSLILLGLVTGYTEVYNLSDITVSGSRVPSLVLFADNLPIYLLSVASDASLRVASVHRSGDVKLWDLWDDGNMYANLKEKFAFPPTSSDTLSCSLERIYGEACTFAWQPNGIHICMAGQKGYGVILQSEKPFTLIAILRSGHYHRISCAVYSHDSSMLVTASYDSSCVVWCVPEYAPLFHFWHMGRVPSLLLLGGANGHHLYGVAVAPDNLHFTTICEDRCVRLWPLAAATSPTKTYYELALSTPGRLKLRSVSYSPCGRLIAVTTSDNRVLLFTTESQVLSLTVQCVRVIRSRITRYLINAPAIQSDMNQYADCYSTSGLATSQLQQAILSLPLPPHILDLISTVFNKSSRPYYYYPVESSTNSKT